MRARDWLALVERKYDDLLHALYCAYMQAVGFNSEVWQEEVLLHSNGNISILSNQIYHMPPKIKSGDAIYIGAIKWFDIHEVTSDIADTICEEAWIDDIIRRLDNNAKKWAAEQLNTTLNDLKLISEFEENDQIYLQELLKI